MTIFAIPEARYFAAGYKAIPGVPAASFRDMTASYGLGRTLTEGSVAFDEFRDGAVRETERLYFLAMANYRRSLSLLTASMASWAHVTMYYSAFYAASSLLGMFGCWKLGGSKAIDVARSTPGSQELVVRSFSTTLKGSHRSFWAFFYANIVTLTPWIDVPLRIAISPVLGSVTWLIDTRNTVNYDSYAAVDGMRMFQLGFRRSRPLISLPGALNTQFQVMEALVRLNAKYARELKIATDALDGLSPSGPRKGKVQRLILDESMPMLDRYVRKRALLV